MPGRERTARILMEALFARCDFPYLSELAFIFVQIIGQGRNYPFDVSRRHNNPGDQMRSGRGIQQPVYHEFFGAVGNYHGIAEPAAGHLIAGIYHLNGLGLFVLLIHIISFLGCPGIKFIKFDINDFRY